MQPAERRSTPNARPVVLAGRGHWTQQERPDEVNAALFDFLAGVDDTETG